VINRSTARDTPNDPMALYLVALLFGTLVAETILASVHVRAHQQAGHMGASDLIKTLQIHLARRVPSTYGSWIWCSATMSAGSGPITHRRTSPQSNIWRAICSEGRAGRIQYVFAERSRHRTMSSSPASSGRNSFARFACRALSASPRSRDAARADKATR